MIIMEEVIIMFIIMEVNEIIIIVVPSFVIIKQVN